ncbi:MAG: caspase family protein [Oscillatoria sp. PMC 1051.18]|nr:caspase family protein [Oscillatoria sp. PMC 1050.18]MEC5032975.1 caspase family protein [Oscillatoria sp. PMC 1051.18]
MSRDALVVGINSYSSYSSLNPLQAPAEDAEAVARLLEADGDFKVIRFPEAIDKETKKPYVAKKQQLSLKQLKKALVRLFKPEAGKNIPDTALFYFSGHGIRITEGIAEGFLATSDINPNAGFYGLSLQWLRRLLQESPIKQQIIWLDCCHSGELFNFITEANPGEQGQAKDRCFIAAAREFEVAYQEIGSNYSVLTKVLLKGLDPQRCPQKWITNLSLVDYLNQNITGTTQRPVFSNSGEPINLTHTWEVETQTTESTSDEAICPYKGLQYFDCNQEDPKYFYGRNQLTDQLLDHLRQNNFLAILGASGSGKSSVLRAGLIHQLQRGQKLAGSQQWEIHLMIPGEKPLESLALALVDPNLPKLDRAAELSKVEGLLQAGSDGFRRLIQISDAPSVVLVIDQFEEVFTLCKDADERKQFFECVLPAVTALGDKFRLIIAMRADFLGKCVEAEYSGLAKKIQKNLVTVTPMNEEELREAITKPAERVKLQVEPELVDQMVKDVADSPGSLPLLQDSLRELWQRREKNCLQLATYINLGRIEGSLNKRATKVYQSLAEAEQLAAKHIFLNLTHLGEGTADTRRRVLQENLVTSQHPENLISSVVQKLAEERLIVTSELVAKGGNDSKAIVDVAHEALIRRWEKLRSWLDECREHLLFKRKIEAAAAEWSNHKQEPDYLWQGKRLQDARKFVKQQGVRFPLSQTAEIFVQRSVRQQVRDWDILIFIFLIVTLVGIYFVYRQLRLNHYFRLVGECTGKEFCLERIDALEELVKANRSLTSINLKDTYLGRANLCGAELADANLNDANLGNANLCGAELADANLNDANLRFTNLRFANLSDADLRFANLADADLNGADLRFADLADANLNDANLNGTDFTEHPDYGKVKNLTPKQVKSACNWQKAKFEPEFEQQLQQEPDQDVDCSRWE